MEHPVVKAYRFSIGTWEGLSSNSWKVWTHDHDAYVACRDNYGEVKWSLHADGGWRMGWTKEAYAKTQLRPTPVSRWWEVWERPPPYVPGVTCALALDFYTSELPLGPEQRPSPLWDDVAMIEPAPDGFFVQILVLLADNRVPTQHPDLPILRLARLRLSTGENVIVLATQQRLTESRRREIGIAYRQAKFSAPDPDAFRRPCSPAHARLSRRWRPPRDGAECGEA